MKLIEVIAMLALEGVNIPKGATHIAQDEDGEWWSYVTEPIPMNHSWIADDKSNDFDLDKLCETAPPEDWRKMVFKL